jgi:hypothetical protein
MFNQMLVSAGEIVQDLAVTQLPLASVEISDSGRPRAGRAVASRENQGRPAQLDWAASAETAVTAAGPSRDRRIVLWPLPTSGEAV